MIMSESFELNSQYNSNPSFLQTKQIFGNTKSTERYKGSLLKLRPCYEETKRNQFSITTNKSNCCLQSNSQTQTTDICIDSKSIIGSGRDQSKLKTRSQSRNEKKEMINKSHSIYNSLKTYQELKQKIEKKLFYQREQLHERSQLVLKLLRNNSTLLTTALKERQQLFNKPQENYNKMLAFCKNKNRTHILLPKPEVVCRKISLTETRKNCTNSCPKLPRRQDKDDLIF